MANELFYSVMVTAGSAKYDLSKDFESLTIDEADDMADQLTINMSDPFKVFSHALQEGMEIEVDLGSVKEHAILFRGRIYQVSGDFPQDGIPTLVLRAHDNSMKMGLNHRSRIWTDQPLSQIVSTIANSKGYSFAKKEISVGWDLKFKGNGIRQQNKTDLDFLLGLASEYSCKMYVEPDDKEDKFVFKSIASIMGIDPQVTLYHGRCGVPNRLVTFNADVKTSKISIPPYFSGIDQLTGEAIEFEVKEEKTNNTDDSFLDENLDAFSERDSNKADDLQKLIAAAPEIQTQLREEKGLRQRIALPGFTTAEELAGRANINKFDLNKLGMNANGSSPGNHLIHAQTCIGIADAGRFSGKWYLTQVRHLLDKEGYRTEFECQR